MTYEDVKWFFGLTFDYWLGLVLAVGAMGLLMGLGISLPLLFPVGTLGLSAVALSCLSVATISAISTVVYAFFRLGAFAMGADKDHFDYAIFPYFRAYALGFALVPVAWIVGMVFLPGAVLAIVGITPAMFATNLTVYVFIIMPFVFPALWLLYRGASLLLGALHISWCDWMTARLNSDHLSIQTRPRTMRLLWWLGAGPLPKLQKAMQDDDIDTINWFLDQGAEADHRLLALAASLGKEDMVKHLLDSGVPVSPDAWQWGGEPSHALIEALKGGYEKIVQQLVSAGDTLNLMRTFTVMRYTLLGMALKGKHDFMVDWLKAKGADLVMYRTEDRERRYQSTFNLAVEGGHYDVARSLYQLEWCWYCNHGNAHEAKTLLQAAQTGDDQLFLQLCEDGQASVLTVGGKPLLAWSVVSDEHPDLQARLALARMILSHDKSYSILSAIRYAAQENCLAFIKLFMELKPDYFSGDRAGSALAIAAKHRFAKLTLLLLEASGVNTTDAAPMALILDMLSDDHRHLRAGILNGAIDVNGTIGPISVLSWAVLWGAFDLVHELVGNAVDVNTREGGRTAMEWALENGDPQLIQLLMFCGAEKHWTLSLCQPASVRQLLQHGWDVSQPDQKEQPQTGQDVLNARQWGDHADALTHLDSVARARKREVVVLPPDSCLGGRHTQIQCTFFRVHNPDGDGYLVDFPDAVNRRMYVLRMLLTHKVTYNGGLKETNITSLPDELLEAILIWVFLASGQYKACDGAWRPQRKAMERLTITESEVEAASAANNPRTI